MADVVVVLALVSALCFGCSDFAGGLAARRVSPWAVTVVAQAGSAVLLCLVAPLVAGAPQAADFGWAVLGGIGTGVGSAFLYRGLATGRMSVVSPVSGVGSALVPVLAGVVGGERPAVLVWVGVVAALPAIWLVSAGQDPVASGSGSGRTGLLDGVLAGLGFGLLFAALGQIPESAGLWPVATNQLTSLPVVVVLALALRGDWVPRQTAALWGLVPAVLAGAANLTFLLATQQGYLTVAGVLAALYPAGTVLLALLVLHERVSRAQSAGLALAAVSVALVAGG